MTPSIAPGPTAPPVSSTRASYLIIAVLAAIAGAGVMRLTIADPNAASREPHAASEKKLTAATAASPAPSEKTPQVVSLAESQWERSGLVISPTDRSAFVELERVTGKVSLNEDRIAHIYPMVEGAVDEVRVGLGDVVHNNDLLAVVHSREVGKAKLELYQARLQQEMALVKDKIQKEIAANAEELLASLRSGESITKIEETFRSRSMGDFRERLLLAYSSYLKSKADVERLEGPAETGAISAKQLFAAEATRNADLATFQARIEQIEYELQTSLLLSSQAVKEAATHVAVASTNLRILGCEESEIESIDPNQQGEAISHYSIRAPFEGTIIAKDVALKEQVRPDTQIFRIADLSTVWVTADIYEQNVPLLNSLAGKQVRVYNEAWPDRVFDATIFYTGEIMDDATRTVAMRAIATNEDHLLKPGMFVTVEFEKTSEQDVITVPLGAIQEHVGQKFVFLHRSGSEFERQDIVMGKTNDKVAVVSEGLDAGDPVVVSGGFILKSLMLEDLMGEE